jgi:hypothetical protein
MCANSARLKVKIRHVSFTKTILPQPAKMASAVHAIPIENPMQKISLHRVFILNQNQLFRNFLNNNHVNRKVVAVAT